MLKKLFLNERFIIGLILLNAGIIFYGGYYTGGYERTALIVADNLITSLFIIELLVKSRVLGIRKYLQSGWNKLDFILIVLSLPAFITFILQIDLFDLSFLLVFRVLRVFKAFRFFRFIPDIDKLTAGVQRAIKASVFIMAGFVIYIFIIGILSFYLFQGTGSEFFSNPMISLYSTFKIFTIEGWFEIPEAITIHYSGTGIFFTYLYFIFVVLTGGIFGLSLVNSIFVDSMVSDNNDELEKKIDRMEGMIIKMLHTLEYNKKHEAKLPEPEDTEISHILPPKNNLL